MGSDVDRDGMYLELKDGSNVVAEVFYSDQNSEMTFTTFENSIPLEQIEQLIEAAKRKLPPIK